MIRLPVAEAIPLAPALAWGLLDLLALVAFVVCIGLLFAWRRTIGAAFNRLARISILGGHPLGFLGDLSHSIESYLSQAAAATEHALVYMFRQLVGSIQWAAQVTSGLATDVYGAMVGLGKRMGELETAALSKVSHGIVALIHKIVDTAIAYERRRWNRIFHHTDAKAAHAAKTAGHALEFPIPRLGRLEKTQKAQSKRLTKLEKLLAGGLGVALLIRALAKLGLSWLRCSNVKRTGRAVCKMDPSLLESLLFDATLLAVTFNLEEFAREMQTVTGEAARLIHNFAD